MKLKKLPLKLSICCVGHMKKTPQQELMYLNDTRSFLKEERTWKMTRLGRPVTMKMWKRWGLLSE